METFLFPLCERRLALHPYSLGILIEWKLQQRQVVDRLLMINPYSLGILIEWKHGSML